MVALSPEKVMLDRWPIDLWCVRWLGQEIEPSDGTPPTRLKRVRIDRVTLLRRERPEQIFGPNGAAVVALIERISRLTVAEVADPGSVFGGRADLEGPSADAVRASLRGSYAVEHASTCVRHAMLARAEEIAPHAVGEIQRAGGIYVEGREICEYSWVMAERAALDAAWSIIAEGAPRPIVAPQT